MDVRAGLWRKLSTEELMLLKCGVGEDSWEFLGLQGDPASPFWRRSALGVLWREWSKLKLQFFGHLMHSVDSLETTLMLGGIGGKRRRGWQRMRWLDGITDSMDMSLGKLPSWLWTGRPGMLQFMESESCTTERLNWTELNNEWCWVSFHAPVSHLYVFFREMSI